MYIQYMFTSIENIDCLCGVRRVNICMEFLGSTSTCISNQTHSNSGAMFSWGGGAVYIRLIILQVKLAANHSQIENSKRPFMG